VYVYVGSKRERKKTIKKNLLYYICYCLTGETNNNIIKKDKDKKMKGIMVPLLGA